MRPLAAHLPVPPAPPSRQFTLDGTHGSHKLKLVVGGVVVVSEAVDMARKLDLALGQGWTCSSTAHSPLEAFVTQFYVGSDKRETVKVKFASWFEFFEKCKKEPWENPRTGKKHWIDWVVPSDMANVNVMAGCGSAPSPGALFCAYCSARSEDRGKARSGGCPVCTKQHLAKLEVEAKALEASLEPKGRNVERFWLPRKTSEFRKTDWQREAEVRGLDTDQNM